MQNKQNHNNQNTIPLKTRTLFDSFNRQKSILIRNIWTQYKILILLQQKVYNRKQKAIKIKVKQIINYKVSDWLKIQISKIARNWQPIIFFYTFFFKNKIKLVETQQYNIRLSSLSSVKNNSRVKLQKNVNPEESQNQSEYQSEAVPGPGYYSPSNNSISEMSSKKNVQSNGSFGGRSQRFKQESVKQMHQIGVESKKNNQSQHKIRHHQGSRKKIPFLSHSPSQTPLNNRDITPSPQQYDIRNGIEDELIKKIQRNLKGNFGVCSKRFQSSSKLPHIGPGKYENQSRLQNKNTGKIFSYYFLSQKQRFA